MCKAIEEMRNETARKTSLEIAKSLLLIGKLTCKEIAQATKLNLLPDTEELLSQIEQQKTRIEQLENENQQWQELTQKLNNENSLLQKQNSELLTLNSR